METADPGRYPRDFAIPQAKVFLGEGGTKQSASPAIAQYFRDVLQVLDDRKLAGIQLWVSDTLGDAKDASGKPTLSPITPAYACRLWQVVVYRTDRQRPLGPAGSGRSSIKRTHHDESRHTCYSHRSMARP